MKRDIVIIQGEDDGRIETIFVLGDNEVPLGGVEIFLKCESSPVDGCIDWEDIPYGSSRYVRDYNEITSLKMLYVNIKDA